MIRLVKQFLFPNDPHVLARGHFMLEWAVRHNGMGHRTGYILLPEGHPWEHENEYSWLLDGIDVHGGVTFKENRVVGFDCAHAEDAVDLSLPFDDPELKQMYEDGQLSVQLPGRWGNEIRTTEYVIEECKNLCRQAVIVMLRHQVQDLPFLLAMLENIDDDAPKLIYADYLEERGGDASWLRSLAHANH